MVSSSRLVLIIIVVLAAPEVIVVASNQDCAKIRRKVRSSSRRMMIDGYHGRVLQVLVLQSSTCYSAALTDPTSEWSAYATMWDAKDASRATMSISRRTCTMSLRSSLLLRQGLPGCPTELNRSHTHRQLEQEDFCWRSRHKDWLELTKSPQ